jgi:AraC family transcriptional regulator
MSRGPEILASGRTAEGLAFQIRKDPPGVLDVPGFEDVLVAIHLGARSHIACRRGGRQFTGTAVHGDIDIIPAETPARWEMHDDNDSALLLVLPRKLLHTVANHSGLNPDRLEMRNRFQIRDSELESLGWAIKREIELDYPSGRLYLDGLALAMASRLVSCHSSASCGASRSVGGLGGRRLKKALAFIEDRLADDLSLKQIAEVAGISPSHFKTEFRKAVGMPVHQYVIQRRVERARILLLQDGLSIAAIAQASGFAHQSHMARHMRRMLGAAPRELKHLLVRTAATD